MTSRTRLSHRERLILAGSAIRGVLSGATRAVATWLLDHLGS